MPEKAFNVLFITCPYFYLPGSWRNNSHPLESSNKYDKHLLSSVAFNYKPLSIITYLCQPPEEIHILGI